MASIIGSIAIGMSVKTEKFKKGLHESRGMLGGFTKALGTAKGAIAGFGAALGAGALLASIKAITSQQLPLIDRTSKFADEVGLTVKQLKGLEFAAGLTGSNLQNLEKGLQRLVRRLGEAKAGFGQGIKGLEQLGLSAEDLTNVSTYDALKKISEAIKSQKGPAEQAAAAYALFGKQGLELLTFLKSGAASMDAATAEAEALGVSFSRLDGAQVEAANDALLRMSKLWEGIKQRITIELAPVITGITKSIVDFGKSGAMSTATIGSSLDGLISILGFVADSAHMVYTTFLAWRAGITKTLAIIGSGIGLVGKGIKWLVNLLPGVKSSFSDTTNAIAEDLHKLASQQWQDAKDNFNKPFPSEAINKFRKDVQRNVAAAVQSAKTGSTQIKESFDEGMFAATDSANKLIDKLKEQIATFGMSATEAELFKLQQQGASQALLDQAKALQNQIDGLEKLKKASEDARAAQQKMKDEAKSIYDATRTPLEKFRAEFLNLVKLFKAGLIDRDTFQRAVAQAKQGFKDATKKDDPKDTSSGGGLSAAIDANSQQARSILLRSRMAGASPINKVEKNTKEQLAEQKKSNEHLAKLATNKPIIFTYQPS